jgi:outer membrane protein assembly factor BamB
MDQPNQHGVLPNGLLVASQTTTTYGTAWRGYDPQTGVLTTMNITNVPGGTNVAGPIGEYLKLILTNYGTSAAPKYMLSQWNSSNVFGVYSGTGTSNWYSGTVNASAASAYDWNVTCNLGPGSWTMSTSLIDYGNLMLLTQGSFGGRSGVTDPANITAVSLAPGSIGNILWTHSYAQAPGNNTRVLSSWDPGTGVFIMWDQEAMDHYGFSLANGNQIWGPVTVPNAPSSDWNYMGDSASQENVLNGKLYWAGYMGFVYCFDDLTGNLIWTFGNGGEGNSTYAPWLPYGYTPLFISVIADGKIYLSSSEHSPNSPLYANYDERCINATTGLEIWALPMFGNLMYGGYTPVASGIMVADNTYDQQIDAVGQGPSALTVTAPDNSATLGSAVVIRGTVTDISAGTKQAQQAADFPNGIPCVSDASMDSWMQYVYMQQPKPANATGVQVTISVTDANGNTRPIGQPTSDSSGMFTLAWTPDIAGAYTVTATFAGSAAYYPSSSETSFAVTEAAPTPTQQPVVAQPPTETYIAEAAAGIIVAIALVGAITIMVLKKRA